MSASSENQRVVARLHVAIQDFLEGSLDIEAMQAALQQALGPLERDGLGAEQLVRVAEVDVEEIRFLVSYAEQQSAVARVVSDLRAALAESYGPDADHR